MVRGGKDALFFTNWFRRFLVGHSQFGWTAPPLSALCVYKSRVAPRSLAHEPTPKKPGEFEEGFVC